MGDSLIPPNAQRVRLHTRRDINQAIKRRTVANIARFTKGDSQQLSERIRTLESEWDTERVLETNAASLILLSTILGLYVNRWWFALTLGVAFFLLTHAVQGWCPPLPIIRSLGIRTEAEINAEKIALKAARGDFQPTDDPEELLAQAQRI